MGEDTADLLRRALALPAEERGKLVASLLESLSPPSRFADDDAFKAELTRRADEMKSGKVKGVPWDEVRKELRQRLESRRGD